MDERELERMEQRNAQQALADEQAGYFYRSACALLRGYVRTVVKPDPGELPDPYRLTYEERVCYYTGAWWGEPAS